LPIVYIVRVRSRRLRKFEEQLPDAIDLFTRTMRAGHNIHSGLETIANETTDPVKMEFKKLMEELALGSPLAHVCGFLGLNVRKLLKTQEGVGVLENLW
jgi:tight adherence protein B